MAIACGASPAPSVRTVPSTPLLLDGATPVDARQVVSAAPFTVFVFFSRSCHCLSQHDARLRELAEAYRPRGVQLILVDPEIKSSPAIDAAEDAQRGYPFPIYFDRGAQLARAFGAEYATYSVIVDRQDEVRYRGGFDSDKTHLRESATPYVRNALDDLLAGRPPRLAEAKTLGCALEEW
ncbi:MAG TPA: redoxin family protein [Polyangiaceae bacterium]